MGSMYHLLLCKCFGFIIGETFPLLVNYNDSIIYPKAFPDLFLCSFLITLKKKKKYTLALKNGVLHCGIRALVWFSLGAVEPWL